MNQAMTASERRATTAIGSIMSLRMLGLFMILPVFALYAQQLPGVTPTLVGLAIGIYGLTQGLLQIPFGMLSDRFGRKPVITVGLLIFVVGSVIAALATDIHGVIVGRALQGSGAISAALMALTADLTREEHRTKAMAVLGMSIGGAFLLALISGPILSHWIGVPGTFWLIAVLALLAIGILYLWVPTPVHSRHHRDAEPVPAQFLRALQDTQLLRLNFGIFSLHTQLTALFVVMPLLLRDAGLAQAQHWLVYLPVMVVAMVAMVPLIILAEKRRLMKPIFSAAIFLLVLTQLGLLALHQGLLALVMGLLLFFIAFLFLESSLPSLVSKTASPDSKGTALGVYATTQFLGAFAGGLGGGWLHQHYGVSALFAACLLLNVLWLSVALTMRKPSYLSNYLLNIGPITAPQAKLLCQELLQVSGVAEAIVICEDGVAYLKVDHKYLDLSALDQYAVAPEN